MTGRQISAHFFNNEGKPKIEWVSLENHSLLKCTEHTSCASHCPGTRNAAWIRPSSCSRGVDNLLDLNNLDGRNPSQKMFYQAWNGDLAHRQEPDLRVEEKWMYVSQGLAVCQTPLKHHTEPPCSLRTHRSLRRGTLDCSAHSSGPWVLLCTWETSCIQLTTDIIQVLQW